MCLPQPPEEDPRRHAERLAALHRLDILDTSPEAVFDMLTGIAIEALQGETALMTLVDADRQYFKSAAGEMVGAVARRRDGPLTHSFCRFVVEGDDILAVGDASTDPFLCNYPGYVEDGVVSYLGAPIRVGNALPVGSLCVTGTSARIWSTEEARLVAALADLAGHVLQHRAELRTQNRLLDAAGGAPVFITDADGRISFWSRDCERVFGWPVHSAEGRDARTLLDLTEEMGVDPQGAPMRSTVLRHRDGSHLSLAIRHVPLGTGGHRAGTVHECHAHPNVETRDAAAPLAALTSALRPAQAPRHKGDTLQLLQAVCELVVQEFSKG